MPIEIKFMIISFVITAVATLRLLYEKNRDKKKNTHN